ncbi:hypothetical protein B0F90DRAFT_1657845 [Multifurca ochricompacta]|uniref:BZIP domain-containing protein n=1 Tax=Multifurca ochricompacta TaxID=376703 RepID=A0AAD4LW85_9AGAM|nr:hypothetical protein B0F90DRAFT_1657845 [Multifurca ochricompacta]
MAQAATSNQSVGSADRPERSRNAKAQARHRAKRKAYIEQLEQTVTKLQTALALSPEQVAALPPPTLRIRQLEQENAKLLRENDELRRQLHMQTRRPSLMTDPHFDIARGRHSYQSSISGDYPDRDIKRRRMSQNVDEVYLVRCPFYLSLPLNGDAARDKQARSLACRVCLPFHPSPPPSPLPLSHPIVSVLTTRQQYIIEPQSDSESTHDRGTRTSRQLFATTPLARLYALVE